MQITLFRKHIDENVVSVCVILIAEANFRRAFSFYVVN